MTTALTLQRNLVVAFDNAIGLIRKMIVDRGASPVPVAVSIATGDGIEAAIRRRKQIHDVLYRQLDRILKGVRRP